MKISPFLAALLLTGCSHYVHKDKARAFDPDYYNCQQEAAPQNQRRKEMIDRCMRLKGWELQRAWQADRPDPQPK